MKIAVGMSGGVDSTMAAYLLKKEGHEVIGLTMKIWGGKENFASVKSGCYGPGEVHDIEAAKKACEKLGIEHFVIDLSKEYAEIVLSYFKSEYAKGKTPNPCVVCNSKMKFGLLLEKAFECGVDFEMFATGHYVRKVRDGKLKRNVLKIPKDVTKDQTYFLYRLKQEQLDKVIFPLGDLAKTEVKKLARESGFAEYADKQESQNFAESKSYADLVQSADGNIVDAKGKILGRHSGITAYTLGQRKGLNLGGLSEPYYVVKIDAKKNEVVVGKKNELLGHEATVENLNFLVNPDEVEDVPLTAKCRYATPRMSCVILKKDSESIVVKFFDPVLAITPGQSLVLYAGDILIGGGTIR
jgi:tRNA-uridine 2-sulfurtransferase